MTTIIPTGYIVSVLPEDHDEMHHFSLTVEYRGPDRYCVRHFGRVLSRTGKWRMEGLNSSRTEKFKEVTRFPLEEALRLAEREAPKITINGHVAADIAARLT